mmetsp:Transcript_45951/g.63852  ORF Transcript_45951/g.63852 Transcript_45951/m.63852 type:complete len:90 (+) Transcript_45951:90-359(+)
MQMDCIILAEFLTASSPMFMAPPSQSTAPAAESAMCGTGTYLKIGQRTTWLAFFLVPSLPTSDDALDAGAIIGRAAAVMTAGGLCMTRS